VRAAMWAFPSDSFSAKPCTVASAAAATTQQPKTTLSEFERCETD